MDRALFVQPHAIAMRRNAIEWRDKHSLDAELELCRLWGEVRPLVAEIVEEVSWRSAVAEPNAFIKREIDPLLAAKFGPSLLQLLERARDDLEGIVEELPAMDRSIAESHGEEDHLEAATDVLTGLVPLAGGLVMGAALPSLAVVSGTAMFGLVATSTLSLPILFGGLAVTGAALAAGAVKTSDLHSLRTRRMLARIDSHVIQAILSREPIPDRMSVLARLREAYAQAARLAMEESL